MGVLDSLLGKSKLPKPKPVKKTLIAVQYISKTHRCDIEVFLDDFKSVLKYGWIFPHSSFTSIGLGGWTRNAAMLRRCLDGLCDKLIVERTKLEAASINFDYRGFAFGNKFLAGDAAGFASGLTGEGIYQAILSGEEVARGILSKNYGYPGIRHLLKMKNSQEKLLRIFSINRYIPHVVFNSLVPLLLKRRNLCRMVNNRYNLV
jgi:geranylgeranyl reductase